MTRRPLWGVLFLSAALALGSVLWLRHMPQVPAVPENKKAFLSAEWGMTPEAVEKTGGAVLRSVEGDQRFYSASAADAPRYRSYEREGGIKFLGYTGKLTYTFRDGRLLAYHVFVTDGQGEKLDADMRKYLMEHFGERASALEEDQPLKLVWQFSDRIVNYWFMPEELSLTPKYTAGYGVTILER